MIAIKLDRVEYIRYFLNQQKRNKIPKKFKRIEKEDNSQGNNRSGKYRRFHQNIYFGNESTSPAVPLPSHSRYTSQTTNNNREASKLRKDFQNLNKGINFEIKPLNENSVKQKLRSNLQK